VSDNHLHGDGLAKRLKQRSIGDVRVQYILPSSKGRARKNIDCRFDFNKIKIYFGKVYGKILDYGKILEVYLVVVVVVTKLIFVGVNPNQLPSFMLEALRVVSSNAQQAVAMESNNHKTIGLDFL